MTPWIPLFVAIPLGAAFLTLLLKKHVPQAAPWLALTSSVLLLALALVAAFGADDGAAFLGGWGPQEIEDTRFVAGIAVVLDGLSKLFLLLVAVVTTAVVVYGFRYLETWTGRPLYHALLMLVVAGMNGAVLAGDLFNLFVFLEVASIASYALVAFGTGAKEVEAAFKYLLIGAMASAAILLGIGVLYGAAGRLNMADLALAVRAGEVPQTLLFFVSALFLAGFGVKSAMMPFHAWLPDAHPSAPAPISAILSGLLIKTLGIYAILRVFYTVLGVDPRVQALLLVLGSVSMLAGVLLAYGQDDFKRLLAYSSISQMGYVLVALGLGTALGVFAAVFHALNHALFKSSLFLASGSLERIAGTRRLSQMGGLAKRAPWTAAATMGASLSISGVPPLGGFWSKLLVLIALFQAGQNVVGTVAAVTAVITLITFVKVQRLALFGPLPSRLIRAAEVPAEMAAPAFALALLSMLVIVLWPLGVGDMVQEAANALRGPPGDGPPAYETYVRLILGRLP